MEIKELVPKLVEHYQRCIDEMPENNWYRYIINNKVSSGISYCAESIFSVWIYGSDFITKFTNNEPLVCLTPMDARGYSEAKELLQIRLNRLKEFL